MSEKVVGNLIIIGGAEDKVGHKEILNKVVSYINKEKDIIRFGYVDSYTYEKNLNIIFNKKDNFKSKFKRGRNYQF